MSHGKPLSTPDRRPGPAFLTLLPKKHPLVAIAEVRSMCKFLRHVLCDWEVEMMKPDRKVSRRTLVAAALLSGALLGLPQNAFAQDEADYVLATASTGGTY